MKLFNIIKLIHILIIAILFSSIFIPNRKLKEMSLTLLFFIFLQYITNHGKCGLTELEYLIKGERYQEGFIYRIVKPIITIPEKYFENYLCSMHITLIIILSMQILNTK